MRFKHRSTVAAVAAWAALFQIAIAGHAAEAGPAELAYQITAKRPADRVSVQSGDQRVVFTVESPSGIGQAEIVRRDRAWPPSVTIHLALRGLEQFRVKAGDTELGVSVSSHDQGRRVRVWKAADERAALADDDPLLPQVRLLDKEGKPTDKGPPEIAAIEIVLPAALLKSQPKTIEFSWIDFYR